MYFQNSIVRSLGQTTFCPKLPGGLFTNWFPTSFGVKQGDNLSPTLFSVFLNDLATEIKKLNAGVDTSDGTVSILLYADDIALNSSIRKELAENA